jgi:hypothetical protein
VRTGARFVALLAVVAGVALVPSGAAADPDHVCGVLPGEGAYGYVKVWNMTCARAEKVAANAYDRFCDRRDCATSPEGGFVTGKTRFNGWKCDLKLAYEFTRIRCAKSEKRFTQEGGA